MTALQPGDLFYSVVPDTGEVVTDFMWTVVENEGVVPPDWLASKIRDKPYWSVQASCDNQCKQRGVGGCYWPHPHYLLLSADDYALAADLPTFKVDRSC